jgi:hypothetical protein
LDWGFWIGDLIGFWILDWGFWISVGSVVENYG